MGVRLHFFSIFKDELVKNVEEVANAFNCIFGKDKKDNQDNQENKGE